MSLRDGGLSHGLPQLITRGNQILRADDMSFVLLRGVNRSGLEYARPRAGGFLDAAGLSQAEMTRSRVGGSAM